ncbi:MAG TPA: OsmC family protein [Dehalococcoidia bacterium]|nr:OsmC family protein [Dehalococcoidia bacterium]
MAETSVVVRLEDGFVFRGTDEDGLSIVMDASKDVAGSQERGPSPMRVLAMALGGCTGIDVISILRKMRQEVTAYEVRVSGPRAGEHPHVFTALEVEHVVHGRALNPENVRRAVELSATRYCPASAMLGKAAPLRHRYRVLDEAGAELATGAIGEP